MAVLGHNWYNAQASRRYPLDANATGTGDDGVTRLSDDILVDCHLRWPEIAGQFAYIGGITITDKLLTVVILGADSPTAVTNFTPLAAVSVVQPVQRHVHYNVQPLYPGVGGFLVFEDTQEPFSIRFSTPQQGLLLPKCARPYKQLPIPTLRKLGRATGLMGLVKILAGPDLEIVKETVPIAGRDRDALVIRLIGSTATRNILSEYIGPCETRPESRNCNKEGVETINGVAPDCNGNINIVFSNLIAGPYNSCGSEGAGVTLDQEFGIDDVCESRDPEKFRGEDYCASDSSSSESLSLSSEALSSESEGTSEPEPTSSESVTCLELPYTEFFDSTADNFDIKTGSFSFDSEESPSEPILGSVAAGSYQATDLSRRNVSVLEDCGYDSTVNKRVTTQVMLSNTGSQHNGGLVLNYRIADPLSNPHIEYFAVVLDRNVSKVRLLRFNGTSFIEEHAVVTGSTILYGDWYSIVAEITESSGQAIIDVTVAGVSDEAWPTVSFSVLTNKYHPATGTFGVGSDRSQAHFSFFQLEDL